MLITFILVFRDFGISKERGGGGSWGRGGGGGGSSKSGKGSGDVVCNVIIRSA